MRLVFTGGHHNSSLALAQHMRESYDAQVLWIGHYHTSLKDSKPSAEYKEVTTAGIQFKSLTAGKVYKTTDIRQWLRLPFGFFQALYYLLRWRPDMIVSFGGYLAVPVVLAGVILAIPSVTHEQTVVSGLANRFIARLAKKIFVTWPSSLEHFPKEKVEVVGLPLRKEIFKNNNAFGHLDNGRKTIYITAGKQGSHVINQAVQQVLPSLLESYNVIHQCGSTSEFNDFATLTKERESLPDSLKSRYELREYVFQDEIGSAFGQADIVIARAGAHTVYELAALKKTALLIPIPWVSHNEQYKNAQILEQAGTAKILPQSELTGESLLASIKEMDVHLDDYCANTDAAAQQVSLNAIEAMAYHIQNLLQ